MKEHKSDAFRATFEASYEGSHGRVTKHYDAELPFADIGLDTTAAIKQVGPFGTDNEQPVFSITHPQVSSCFYMGKDKNHIKLTITKGNDSLAVVGFNKKYLTKALLPYIDQLFVHLEENRYQGRVKLQGMMQGMIFAAPQASASVPVVDLRQEKYVMGFADTYLLFDDKTRSRAVNT
ncbi:single-stranded-DNA-specific exonuclease RecJ, partial [Lactobacillus sp. XV13L]|nr:single-stranded-DNA-specific exonuclease RecJ [Lactobacillus sp. XV13L]